MKMERLHVIFIYFLIICLTVSVTRSFSICDKDSALSESNVSSNDNSNNSSNNSSSDSHYDDDDDKKREHGALDSVGRDIVMGIDKSIDKIRGGVSRAIDKVHGGVGRALDTVIKSTNYTIKKVHDGVDKTVDKIHDNVEKVVDTVEKIKIKISNRTLGLDTNTTFFNGVIDKFKEKVKAIYPGTKWCGDGDRARDYDDLGEFAGTDACCREHDYCPDNIAAGQTKYDLINNGLFTRSHCGCDKKFYDCLKTDGSIVSKKIGFTYFTILGPQCFKKEYPIINCNKSEHGKCIDYEFERSGQLVFQWFDSPKF